MYRRSLAGAMQQSTRPAKRLRAKAPPPVQAQEPLAELPEFAEGEDESKKKQVYLVPFPHPRPSAGAGHAHARKAV